MKLPWAKHQQLIIVESGPWIAKELTGGTFAYCPNCRAYPQTKFGASETGTIKCGCYEATAKIIEIESRSS